MHRVYGGDASALSEVLASSRYFNKVWPDAFPTLRLKVRGDFMACGKCVTLNELQNGGPGQRAVQDKNALEAIKAEYDSHVKVRMYVCRGLRNDTNTEGAVSVAYFFGGYS